MKIQKYKKLKNGMYQVIFENFDTVILHENIILKYDLLITKEVNDDILKKMLKENSKYIGIDLALHFLAKKMRSTKEVDDYLKKNDIDKLNREEIIKYLKSENYLNDLEFAKAYVNDRIILSNDGPNKIENKLVDLGIDNDLINKSITFFTEESQIEKIEKIANKLINTNKNKSKKLLKNKIIEYLYNLGYSKELINKCIEDLDFKDDKDIMRKEYDKIYKKLSKKYSGKELEYKIKQKMYLLGFNNYEE